MNESLDFTGQWSVVDPNLINVINILNSKKLFANIILIDLTYLNSSKKYGSSVGTAIKEFIVKFIDNRSSVIFTRVIGGKIIFFDTQELSEETKKTINEHTEKAYKTDKRVVYMISEEVGPFKDTPKITIENALKIESQLSNTKGNIQELLKVEGGAFARFSKTLNILSRKFKRPLIDIDHDLISARRIARDSKDLTMSLDAYAASNFDLAKKKAISYLLWIEVQKLMYKGFEIEKVKSQIQNRRGEGSENKFLVDSSNLIDWFSSTLKPLVPYMDLEQRKKLRDIEVRLKIIQEKGAPEIYIKDTINFLNIFMEKFNPKGVFNIPLNHLQPSQGAFAFFNKQFHILFGSEMENKKIKWVNSNFVKSPYPLVCEGTENKLLDAAIFLHEDLIKESGGNLAFHLGFLEIDGFNAFNMYMFGNDRDSIYNKILDIILENTNIYLKDYENLFSRITIGVAGDEFFFLFLTRVHLSKREESVIVKYLSDIKKEIVKLTKDYVFARTEKINILTEKGILTCRKVFPLEDSTLGGFEVEVANLGVSSFFSFNNEFSKNVFSEIFEFVDAKMKVIKLQGKGKLYTAEKRSEVKLED